LKNNLECILSSAALQKENINQSLWPLLHSVVMNRKYNTYPTLSSGAALQKEDINQSLWPLLHTVVMKKYNTYPSIHHNNSWLWFLDKVFLTMVRRRGHIFKVLEYKLDFIFKLHNQSNKYSTLHQKMNNLRCWSYKPRMKITARLTLWYMDEKLVHFLLSSLRS